MNIEISVTKADSGTDEAIDKAHVSGGVRPRPIRKRGYHRALKRGEAWATSKRSMEVLCNNLALIWQKKALEDLSLLKTVWDEK
jgi:hypothetical protein